MTLSTIYNVPNVLKGYATNPSTETGIQNIPANSEYFSEQVRAWNVKKIAQKRSKHVTTVYKTLGVEKALQHVGRSKLARYHAVRTIFTIQNQRRC